MGSCCSISGSSNKSPPTKFMGGKFSGYERPTPSYRYNSGFNYVEDDAKKSKITHDYILDGKYANRKPVSYRYNSGFNYNG